MSSEDTADADVAIGSSQTDASKTTDSAITTMVALKNKVGLKQPRLAEKTPQQKGTRQLKGLGMNGAKRHAKQLRDNIAGVTGPALRRLARRGGVKRININVYEEARGVLKIFLQDIIRDSVMYTEHANRKTVLVPDVVHALKRNGKTLYGYGNGF